LLYGALLTLLLYFLFSEKKIQTKINHEVVLHMVSNMTIVGPINYDLLIGTTTAKFLCNNLYYYNILNKSNKTHNHKLKFTKKSFYILTVWRYNFNFQIWLLPVHFRHF